MFIGHDSRFFARRTRRHKKARVESPGHKSRRNPSADVYQRRSIDMHAGFFQQFPRRAEGGVFVGIELPSRECIKPALKRELERSANPEHFELWILAHQDN